MRDTFSLSNKTRASLRGIPFKLIKEKTLGPRYELSLAIIGSAEMRRDHHRHQKEGQGLQRALLSALKNLRRGADLPAAAKPYSLEYLFIHGCLHLKGMRHGVRMERTEQELLKR